MAKDTVNDYSTTPGNNSDIAGTNIAENCSPANLNNAIREGMADIADVIAGNVRATNWYTTSLNVSGTATIGTLSITALSAATLSLSGNSTIGGTLGVTGAITGSSTITGTVITGSRFVPNANTAATNGMYLPDTNTLGFSTNSTERLRFNASGAFGLGGANYGTSGQVLTSGGSSAAPTWEDSSSYDPSATLAATLAASFSVNTGAGNLLLKAGSSTTVGGEKAITFASAFPTACVAVVFSSTDSDASSPIIYRIAKSASGFTFAVVRRDTGADTDATFDWIAVGY